MARGASIGHHTQRWRAGRPEGPAPGPTGTSSVQHGRLQTASPQSPKSFAVLNGNGAVRQPPTNPATRRLVRGDTPKSPRPSPSPSRSSRRTSTAPARSACTGGSAHSARTHRFRRRPTLQTRPEPGQGAARAAPLDTRRSSPALVADVISPRPDGKLDLHGPVHALAEGRVRRRRAAGRRALLWRWRLRRPVSVERRLRDGGSQSNALPDISPEAIAATRIAPSAPVLRPQLQR